MLPRKYDLAEGSFPLDWVTMELSTVFHPQGPARNGTWPTFVESTAWANATAFCGGSPFCDFVAACREAARQGYAGPRELYAAAYSYLLRQLSYEDTDKPRTLALLEAVRVQIEST